MGLLKQTTSGIIWIGSFRFASRLIAYLKLAIIARILVPEQFGVYAIATIVLAFLEIFTETGINTVLIQEGKNINKFLDTAWIVSILRGFLIGILIIIFTVPIAAFFDSQEVKNVLYLISLVPIIRGFINPAIVKFQKDLLFKKEFVFRFCIFLVDAFFGVVATIILRNPIGLIWGFVAGAVFELILSFIVIGPVPKFKLNKNYLKMILSRGKWITGSGIARYLFSQGDDIVVGKILGTASLGIYQAAYKLSTLPVSEVADVVGKVTFPVFVKIANDKKKLRLAFIKTILITSLGALVLGIGIYVFADKIVFIILGTNWLSAIPIVRVLIVFGVVQAVLTSFNPLFLAVKKQNYVTGVTFLSTLLLAVSIIPFISNFGLLGTAYAVVFSSSVALPLAIYFTLNILKND